MSLVDAGYEPPRSHYNRLPFDALDGDISGVTSTELILAMEANISLQGFAFKLADQVSIIFSIETKQFFKQYRLIFTLWRIRIQGITCQFASIDNHMVGYIG